MRSNIRRDLRSEIRIVAASLEDGTQPESNIHIFISVDCMHPVFEIRDQDISSVTRIQYLRSEIKIVAASAEVGTHLIFTMNWMYGPISNIRIVAAQRSDI